MIGSWLSPPISTNWTPTPCASCSSRRTGSHLAPEQDRPAHPRTLAAQTLALWGQDGAPAGGAGPAVRGNGRSRPGCDDRGARTASGKPSAAKGQAKRKPCRLKPIAPRSITSRTPPSALRLPDEAHRRGCGGEARLHPGTFSVERHIRGKWVCGQCETLVQAPVPAHVIDKGIPTAGLLAQVLVAKYQDHLPSTGKKASSAGQASPFPNRRWPSGSARWVQLQPLVDALKAELLAFPVLHADETPVAMLDPGAGKTHRAYLWSYSIGAHDPVRAVIYDFAESRAGKHAQDFLGDWRGTLVCDDYAGYKALIAKGVTEAGCMAHARRKFFELQEHRQSQIAGEALERIAALYAIEQEVREPMPRIARRCAKPQAQPLLEDFWPGCWRVGARFSTGHPVPRPSTTPSSAGRR